MLRQCSTSGAELSATERLEANHQAEVGSDTSLAEFGGE